MAKNSLSRKEVRELWIKALESGEYKQIKGRLRNNEGFCCLGVLCDLAVKEGVIPEPVYYGKFMYGESESTGTLPSEVKHWVGLTNSSGYFKAENVHAALIEMNDFENCSFKEIAEVIKSKPEGLFVDEV